MSEDRYAEAEQRYLSGDWAGAARLLEEAVTANPEHLEAWVMLAAAARQLRDFDRSAQAYERASNSTRHSRSGATIAQPCSSRPGATTRPLPPTRRSD